MNISRGPSVKDVGIFSGFWGNLEVIFWVNLEDSTFNDSQKLDEASDF